MTNVGKRVHSGYGVGRFRTAPDQNRTREPTADSDDKRALVATRFAIRPERRRYFLEPCEVHASTPERASDET
jgi:hypothetical protein